MWTEYPYVVATDGDLWPVRWQPFRRCPGMAVLGHFHFKVVEFDPFTAHVWQHMAVFFISRALIQPQEL